MTDYEITLYKMKAADYCVFQP